MIRSQLEKIPMADKARISVVLPRRAPLEVREQMLRNGYTLREKSKWYSEAIEEFLNKPDYLNYIEMVPRHVGKQSKVETLYIPMKLDQDLESSVIKVRQKYPALEGVKSLIVRASVIQKLLARSNSEV